MGIRYVDARFTALKFSYHMHENLLTQFSFLIETKSHGITRVRCFVHWIVISLAMKISEINVIFLPIFHVT